MEKVVVIDGECVLCTRLGRLLRGMDKKGLLQILPSSSADGQQVLAAHGLNGGASVVYVENGRAYMASEAVIRLLSAFRGPWSILRLLLVLPGKWRDLVYFWVARNRYRWFGRNLHCEADPAAGLSRKPGDRN